MGSLNKEGRRKRRTGARRYPHEAARVCRAIHLLAEGVPPDEVARAIHALPETLAAWQRDDDFTALVRCMREADRSGEILARLADLTPEAIEAMREALLGDNRSAAVSAAKDVFDRIGIVRQRAAPHQRTPPDSAPAGQVIRVEYVNRDGQAVSTSPWADRHPAPSGALQDRGVRSPFREDGNGQDSAD